jgi:hypothetical protein
MITPEDKERLKPILGLNYTTAVLKVLADKGMTQDNGKPYSAPFVRNVFCGTYERSDIEIAIYEVYKSRLDLKKQAELSKSQLFTPSEKEAV